MPDDTPLEAPVAPTALQQRPGLLVGIAVGLLVGFYTLLGAGGLDDGFQWADLGVILAPVMTGGIIDRLTFSQAQADEMATRPEQRRAVKRKS